MLRVKCIFFRSPLKIIYQKIHSMLKVKYIFSRSPLKISISEEL